MDEKLKNKKISAISLGCDKNRVDLEKMLHNLKTYGFEIVEDVKDANIVVVNTCAFIEPARKEAVEQIFEMCVLKEKGNIEKVIVSGCLAQRYKQDLQKEISEIDAILTSSDNDNICEIIEGLYEVSPTKRPVSNGRVFTCRGAYAYLKIAEGCSNVCSFCTIPRIKGRYQSFEIEKIVSEAKYLAKNNIKELILVAQDVTRYGEDLYGKNSLIALCKKLVAIEGIEFVRMHYAYPEKVTDELLQFIEKEPKMCKYLDIPLQHISDKILTSMRRRMNEDDTVLLINKLKEKYPDFALRTTFIVGYPGETRKDFLKLCQFIKNAKFDYAGFFPYYREENTPSFYLKKQVSNATKKSRLKTIQKIQRKIVLEKAVEMLDKTHKVLIDYFDEDKGVYVGHTQLLSPTVDFGVEIEDNQNIQVGKVVEVKFFEFDGQNYKGVYYESSK